MHHAPRGVSASFFSLRRKYRRLEEAVGKGGGAVGQPGPSAVPAPRPTPLPAPLPAVLPHEDRSTLQASVAHLGRDSAKGIIKVVAQKRFSGHGLETHSLTGKRSVKFGEAVRPPLDNVRLDLLEQLARGKCPELDVHVLNTVYYNYRHQYGPNHESSTMMI